MPPGDSSAATDLRVDLRCSKTERRKSIADLTWKPAAKPGTGQQVDVTIFEGGFERGEFDSSGLLPPDQSSLVWEQVRGPAIHFWRVLTFDGNQWVTSDTGRFEGLNFVDFVPPTLAPTMTPTPVTAPPTPILIVPPGDSSATTDLRAELRCSYTELRKAIADLTWKPAAKPGTRQRVDVTIFGESFERGAFDSSGLLPPDRSSLVWEQVRGRAFHSWRVLTFDGNQWVTSDTGRLVGVICVADFVVPPHECPLARGTSPIKP